MSAITAGVMEMEMFDRKYNILQQKLNWRDFDNCMSAWNSVPIYSISPSKHYFCLVLVCREEVHQHMSRAAQHSQRAAELEGLLATVKTRVQDLEDRCLGKAVQQLSHTQLLQQENQEMQVGQLGIIHGAGSKPSKPQNASAKITANCFTETVSGSGAEAVQTEGRSSTASEETLFLHQRRRATGISAKADIPGHLQQSLPAEFPPRPAVSLLLFWSKLWDGSVLCPTVGHSNSFLICCGPEYNFNFALLLYVLETWVKFRYFVCFYLLLVIGYVDVHLKVYLFGSSFLLHTVTFPEQERRCEELFVWCLMTLLQGAGRDWLLRN